jgi:N-acetylmuramoyl-L-alanine amidase
MANNHLSNRILKLLIILLGLFPVITHAADVTNVRVTHFEDYTRVIFNIAAPDKYNVFTLDGPRRAVVDLYQGHLKTDVQHLQFDPGSGISNVRTGHPVPNTLRIVFDLSGRTHVKSYLVAENHHEDAQLVLDIYANTVPAKPLNQSQTTEPKVTVPPVVEAKASEPTSEPKIIEPHAIQPTAMDQILIESKPVEAKRIIQEKAPIKVVTKTVTVTSIKKPQIIDTKKTHRLVVVIDPGHGGKDPGTVGMHGTQEKDVVLAVALRLADLINSEPNMHAVLTRNGDYFVTLHNRLMMSRQSKADLFIAIHADSYFNDQSVGASVYALSRHGATSMSARWLADRENHSELGGVNLNELGDKSYILRSVLIDLAQTATINDSIKLGTYILGDLDNVTTLHYPRVEQAPFMVLKSPDIPSVLVEMGFLSNPMEEEHLREVSYRDKMARALLAGVHSYVHSHPLMANNNNSHSQTIT